MYSTDFTIDSLLDDLDEVDSTNHGNSKYSNPKYAPHPPNGEKSQSQVGIVIIYKFTSVIIPGSTHSINEIIAESY